METMGAGAVGIRGGLSILNRRAAKSAQSPRGSERLALSRPAMKFPAARRLSAPSRPAIEGFLSQYTSRR